MQIDKEFELTQDEVIKCSLSASKLNTRRLIMCLLLFLLLTGACFAFAITQNDTFMLVLGIVMAVLSAFILICTILVPIQTKKNQKNFEGGIQYKYSFNNKNFSVETILQGQKANTKVLYTALEKISENKDYYFFFINKISFFILKKGVLSEEETEKLNEVFKPYIKK